ncbi:bifunctional hydroxymethylpyrimidine kinase/phosphomethylpyrimidine kinase [Scopulibacillus cellulosilyticus]|uniref:Hydroxymethylpyrimidine/phosphomethylpyrimidine kinase n=1 Tax=Scopulibacillus cellulosilyticus TaxID=2665665 RepID=A0ABW2Q000_9BACL
MKTVLTIAGSDSSGGAGIQADLKTFSAHGVYGMSVIAAVTAQNTQGVLAVEDISPDMIGKQIDAIFTDIPVHAVKIGMVSDNASIKIIADKLKIYQPEYIVLDPVMVSKSGYDLLKPEAKQALIEELLPLATVITPNLKEAGVLIDQSITDLQEMEQAAEKIYNFGPKAVLIKGGHLEGEPVDVLYDGNSWKHFNGKRINKNNTHGTGCTLSSAIAGNLANGHTLEEAVLKAKTYIEGAIDHGLAIGKGVGPTNHLYQWFPETSVID